MPPVLDIAFMELARGAEQKLFANQAWFGVHQRHHIL
jgi:hypothetical protein